MMSNLNKRRPERALVVTNRARCAAHALVRAYSDLSRDGAHLLAPVLGGAPPRQWDHYPPDDAVSRDGRYQWFYHSHDPDDRSVVTEHGHFHLFARIEDVAAALDLEAEQAFLSILGVAGQTAKTRHLLAIGMNAVGIPTALFTVNRWVTGDLPLSGRATVSLLTQLRLNTGFPLIDKVLTSIVRLHAREVRELLAERDRALLMRAARGPGALDDESFEILSARALDVDRRLALVRRRKKTGGTRT